MPALEPQPDDDARSDAERSDAELIASIREGDTAAIDELYQRHYRAALAFAESIAGRTLAPDLVSDAFLRILDLLQRGGGPSQVFRSYLYTTVRNLYIDHIRHHSRQTPLPDFGPLEAEFALGDGLDDRFEHSLVKKAFSSLPERWQVALWYTTVEGVSLEDAGTYLGVAPNAVAALTFRAREGLRQAYLAEHLSLTAEQTCSDVWEALPKYVRGGLRARMRATVEEHLPTCRSCSTAVLELGEVNSNLRGVLVVALLGSTTAGYLDSTLGGTPPAPTPVTPPSLGVGRLGRVGRFATAAGTAAAVGFAVLVWPHHTAPSAESGRQPQAQPGRTQPQARAIQPTPAPVRPGIVPVLARNAVPLVVAYRGPSAQSTAGNVQLGRPSSKRLTTSTPSWFHVSVPITVTGARPGDVTLELAGSGWSAYHVHREAGFGAWECQDAGTDRLTCRLPSGSTELALGLDLQGPGRMTVAVTVTVAGQGPVSTTVAVG